VNPGRRNALFLLSSLALVAFQWPQIRALYNYAADTEHTNASQVLLIPFVSAFLIFRDRQRIFSRVQSAVLPGVLIALLGFGLAVAGHFVGSPADAGDRLALPILAILVVWLGLFVAFYGMDAFRAALFPLLFLAFCMPIPSAILKPLISVLHRGSAEISYILLSISGTPVYREAFTFHMPTHMPTLDGSKILSIEVAPECSGIRSFLSMLILTILAGHMLLKTTWRRLALVLVAIPIMIFKNAVRIATLTLLSIHVDPAIIASRLHREGGIPFFLLALLLTYPILKALMRSERTAVNDAGEQSMLREANL
jgi:exosortase